MQLSQIFYKVKRKDNIPMKKIRMFNWIINNLNNDNKIIACSSKNLNFFCQKASLSLQIF